MTRAADNRRIRAELAAMPRLEPGEYEWTSDNGTKRRVAAVWLERVAAVAIVFHGARLVKVQTRAA